MIRRPSLQKEYDALFSGDPALKQPPPATPKDATPDQAEASAAAAKAYAADLARARETGDWTSMLVGGADPTKFVMRPIPGHVFRELVDLQMSGRLGNLSAASLFFRAALLRVVNFGAIGEVKLEIDQTYSQLGPIATPAIADELDAIDLQIVPELGFEAFRRAGGPSPKS